MVRGAEPSALASIRVPLRAHRSVTPLTYARYWPSWLKVTDGQVTLLVATGATGAPETVIAANAPTSGSGRSPVVHVTPLVGMKPRAAATCLPSGAAKKATS